MPAMGGSGKLDAKLAEEKVKQIEKESGFKAGSPAKPGDPSPESKKLAAPNVEPKRTQAQVQSAAKAATSQAAAAKKSQEMAEAQVKAGAGEHQKKGGDAKPAPSSGKMPASPKDAAPAPDKGNAPAAKANELKAAAAPKQAQQVDAQKGNPGKADPGANLAKDSKAAEAAKQDEAASKGQAAAAAQGGGAKQEEKKEGKDAKGKEEAKDKPEAADPAQIAKTPGAAPDAKVKEAVEKVTGQDLSEVKVHEGPAAQAAAEAVEAKAFTVGQDIAMGKGADKETLAHELAHAAQNKEAGGAAAPPGSISKPGDPAEKQADAMAAAAKEEKALEAPKPASPAKPPKVARMALPGAAIQRTAGAAAGGTAEKKEATKFQVNLGNRSITINIPAGKNGAVTKNVSDPIPGLDAPRIKLDVADGQVSGGRITGKVGLKEAKGSTVGFEISASGVVSGEVPIDLTLDKLGTLKVPMKLAGGALRGQGKLAPGDLSKMPKDCKVESGSGAVLANGTGGSVSGSFKGKGDFGGGKLKGDIDLSYKEGDTKGNAQTDVELESFKKAWANGVKNMPKPPKFPLKYEGGKWSGDASLPYSGKAPGSQGSSTVVTKYENGKFTGSGSGEFSVLDGLLKGKVETSISNDGSVEGKFIIETPTFKVGPLDAQAKLEGGIKKGEIDAKATGTITGLDSKAKGTFSAGFTSSGAKWHGDVDLVIPKMKSAKIGIDYEVGKGFKGEGTIVPDIKGLDGQAKAKLDKGALSGEGAFKINLPLVKGADLKVKYANGKISGQAKLETGAFNIPQVTVTKSSITAGFDGENFSLGGSADISMAGGKVKGTLSAKYDQAKGLEASADSTVSIPGLNPIALKLELKGEKLSGSAKTTVSIPYAKSAELEVTYNDGKFGGKANVEFDIPFIKAAKGQVELSPEGKLKGSLAITGNDINIAPLKVENPTIKGEVDDGKLAISGGGTVKGIPGCEQATLAVSMSKDQKFSGKIDAQLKIPGLKETKIGIELKDGKIKGSASVAAEFKGAAGAIKVNYDDGKWSGKGTLGYKKGKFDGKIEAKLSEAGKLSGKGSLTYAITSNFKVTAEVELREDATMKIGGKIQVPSRIPLFSKEFKKNLFKFTGRFGIPGLSIQLPVVGVVGLEVQLGGSADIFAGMDLNLVNVTASGSFDTATDDVQLQIGGGLQGRAWAGVGIDLRAAAGLGVGPAFIGGYLNARGEGKIEAQVTGNVGASYSSANQELSLDVGVNASAGLSLSLTISAGFTASIDLFVKTLRKDFPFGSKTWTYNPGISFDYNPKFKYTFGKQPDEKALMPASKPAIDQGALARGAGSAVA